MKKTILIALILLAGNSINAQSTLQVDIKDCRQESSFEYLSEFKVFRNETLIKTVEPKHENQQILENLKFGCYRIQYKTMFDKTESVNIELTEYKTYNIDLCLDKLDHELDSYQPIINRLKNGESYSIQITSRGCFHYTETIIRVKRKFNKYYAAYEGQEKLLNDNEIKAIQHFEIELNYMESYGCTTVDTYLIKYNNKKIKISDGSCDWNGGNHLKKMLNLKSKKN